MELICSGNNNDPERIGRQMLERMGKLRNEHISHMTSGKHKKYVIRSLRKGETELLKWQGYERASLAVQKANYAVKMYGIVNK